MQEITIEKLQEADLDHYKVLIEECFGKVQSPKTYQGLYKPDANYQIIVAKADAALVGAISMVMVNLFTFADRPFLMLFDVCVSQHLRKAGIATKLFAYVLHFAKANGYHSISLTCLEAAHEAHAFYEKMGFKKTASRKYYLGL